MIVSLRAQLPPGVEVEIEVGDEMQVGRGEPGTVVSVRVSGRTLILGVEIPDDHPLVRALEDRHLRVSMVPPDRSTSTWNPSDGRRRLGR